jgi:hypothetical protein
MIVTSLVETPASFAIAATTGSRTEAGRLIVPLPAGLAAGTWDGCWLAGLSEPSDPPAWLQPATSQIVVTTAIRNAITARW